MDLHKIHHELIAGRTAEAWYRIPLDGPEFHYRWSYGGSPREPFSHIMSEHAYRAVCREEPSLTMSWGMPIYDRDEEKNLEFEWSNKFTDRKVHPFWVDIFWNNALIDRVELARVDGTHGTIPIPDSRLEVSDLEVAVAVLVHDLENGQEHDHPSKYLTRISAKTVRDSPRWGAGSE